MEVDFVEGIVSISEPCCLDFPVISLVQGVADVLLLCGGVKKDLVIEELLILDLC